MNRKNVQDFNVKKMFNNVLINLLYKATFLIGNEPQKVTLYMKISNFARKT